MASLARGRSTSYSLRRGCRTAAWRHGANRLWKPQFVDGAVAPSADRLGTLCERAKVNLCDNLSAFAKNHDTRIG